MWTIFELPVSFFVRLKVFLPFLGIDPNRKFNVGMGMTGVSFSDSKTDPLLSLEKSHPSW